MRMVTEEMMREALEGKFTYYVGRPQFEDTWTSKRIQRKLDAEERERRRLAAQQVKAQRQYEVACTVLQFAQEPDPRLIIASVAIAHNTTIADILGPRRTLTIKLARHHAAWELRRRKPSLSLAKIGLYLGRRDHSTVLNSWDFVEHNKKNFTDKIEKVEQLLTEARK